MIKNRRKIRMKKSIALIFALIMIFALASCGGSSTTEAGSASNASAETSSVVKAPTDGIPENDAASEAAGYESLRLNVSLQATENETAGKCFKAFAEYITEKTGNAVTFNINYGGTIANPMEELELISSGAIDMCVLAHVMYTEQIPLLNFPSQMKGDADTLAAFAEYMLFSDNEVAKLVTAEAEAHNLKYLCAGLGGSGLFCASKPFESIADLRSLKIGNLDTPKFAGIDCTAVMCMPNDAYEALSRGVIDAYQLSIDGIYNLKMYEVAPYLMYDGMSAFAGPFTINLDKWNSFSPALQELFMEAADMVKDLYVKYTVESEKEWSEIMKTAGATIGTLSEEDQLAWAKACVDVNFANQMATAEAQGIAEQMAVIQDAVVGFFDWLQ
jgi:TRAP-type C4-dicarboxylate transport system substrate-binding protein